MSRAALLAAALLAGGCGVSPQPEPPAIDIRLLTFGEALGGAPAIIGGAGAVTPGGGTLSALDLDSTTPGTSAIVDADGAFIAPIDGGVTDVYRLQALLGALRSDPVDVTSAPGVAGGQLVAADEPLPGCFTIDPPLEAGPLAAGEAAPITLTNGCAVAITIGDLKLRLGSPAWTVTSPPLPLSIPPSGAISVTAAFDPAAGGARDDVLFVQVTAPEAGRRTISLRGEGP